MKYNGRAPGPIRAKDSAFYSARSRCGTGGAGKDAVKAVTQGPGSLVGGGGRGGAGQGGAQDGAHLRAAADPPHVAGDGAAGTLPGLLAAPAPPPRLTP